MSNVYFAGDLHFGHIGITKFRPVYHEAEHRETIIENFNSVLGKRDSLWLMGDIAFSDEMIDQVARITCAYKFLVLGNHDCKNIARWMTVVDNIYGITKQKGMWLSHAPIHPEELRGKINVHGHVHYATLDDPRYFNVSLENIGYKPISLKEIKDRVNSSGKGILVT